ncbi:hypothetical protein P7H17_03295 [Paenibacillus larvae]|nr:hypothetical protein [Paenibacillus larvae]AQR76776.1 hypothetical protein BXP28_04620 [Paenibacillus larvae subsp. larvae]MDT2254684.1 hypothetical protein [Paenibacillus larvae]MDT2264461.1 hypothetical protein [Paenibacillus larvae]MDT2276340.1 hypothetical protein [Paenibacillus larvae]MDT2285319.1 hypothetical protein [Paenibacillus larvae]
MSRLVSVGILSFALFTTMYHWVYLASSIVWFVLLACHTRRQREPFLEPFLFRNKRYISGVLIGALLLGTVAGFISMVPYLMREVYQYADRPHRKQYSISGYIKCNLIRNARGMLADRRGHIIAGFLVVFFYTDRTPWHIAGTMILTFGGLSFVKTVISASAAKALKPDEAGSGMACLILSASCPKVSALPG